MDAATSVFYNDKYILDAAFYFPQYSVDVSSKIPGMRWQTYSVWADKEAKWEQGTWVEEYIPNNDGDNTACYPGFDVWDKGEISYADYNYHSFGSYYIINTLNSTNDTKAKQTPPKNGN